MLVALLVASAARALDGSERVGTVDEAPVTTTSSITTTTTTTTSQAPTTTTSTTTTTTTAGPIGNPAPTDLCQPDVMAADLGVPADHVEIRLRQCVDGYSLAVTCNRADAETCPEGYSVLELVEGRWARLGHSLQTCVEELEGMGVPGEIASQFEGFVDCFSPDDQVDESV